MIEVNNLIKKFGDFRALDGVNMHVASGNIYGLVGPNGAGKSTLIRHLTGVYRQDAGEIFIDGAPVYENKQVKAQMAYIPDEPFYFLQADTLEMMRYFRGMYESFDEKMFYRLQEFFPGIDMKRNIRRLSKGMQKQVAFWLALCCRPKLLILDEPLDGLDPVMRKQIWTILMSEVTHLRNRFASGFLLSRMTSYSPSSVMKFTTRCLPRLSETTSVETMLSPSRSFTCQDFNPNILHTSAKQNSGSPFSPITVLILPNSGLSKILISCVIIK